MTCVPMTGFGPEFQGVPRIIRWRTYYGPSGKQKGALNFTPDTRLCDSGNKKDSAFVDTTSILSNNNRGRRQPDPCPATVAEKAELGLLLTGVDDDATTSDSLVRVIVIDNSLVA